MPENKLPIYRAVLSDEEDIGVFTVSLVDDPAIQKMGITMSAAQRKAYQPVVIEQEGERRIIATPLLIPDQMIYRNQPGFGETGEGYLVWEKDTIAAVMRQYNQQGRLDSFNIGHSASQPIKAYFKGMWLVQGPNDKARNFSQEFKDLPDGTWFGLIQIATAADWQYLKRHSMTNASIEAVVYTELLNPTTDMPKPSEQLKQLAARMSKHPAMAAKLEAMADVIDTLADPEKPGGTPAKQSATPPKGKLALKQENVIVKVDGGSAKAFIDEATGLFLIHDANDVPQPAAAGEYVLEDGRKVIVADGGVISGITEVETEMPAEMEGDTTGSGRSPVADAVARALQSAHAQEMAGIKQQMATMEAQLRALGKQPAGTPAKPTVPASQSQSQQPGQFSIQQMQEQNRHNTR